MFSEIGKFFFSIYIKGKKIYEDHLMETPTVTAPKEPTSACNHTAILQWLSDVSKAGLLVLHAV